MTREPREALVAWRASTGYSHREVGALFGVSRSAVGWWETGRGRVPARVRARLVAEGWLPRRRRTAPPPQYHDPPCAETVRCRSCATRRRHAAGQYTPKWNAWRPEHCARLHALAGSLARPDIAAQLSAEFGIPRTPNAVKVRAHRLGLSLQCAALSSTQIAYYCARHPDIAPRWVTRGWLRGRQPAGPHSPYVFTEADFEAFLRAHYAWVDWRQMPRSRWRDLVEVLWRRDPIYSLVEAAQFSGIQASTLRDYCTTGRLPAERIQGGRQTGRWWAVRRSALARVQVRRPASLGNQNARRSA